MKKVRWGVLSTAKIGTGKVIPAMQQGELCDVVAISSRTIEAAQAAADKLNIPRAYGSYDALLSDPDIDAVYNPLPNNLHVYWSIKALEAGKHVLCEKPIGMDAADAQKLLNAAGTFPKLKIMEAFVYPHHPQWQKIRQLVDEGKIGTLRTVQTFFSNRRLDPKDIRNIPETGGGALMDLGCYCISQARLLFEAEPRRVCGIIDYDPQFNVDRLTSGVLDFETGTSTFTCGTQLIPFQRVNIFGSDGRIECDVPFGVPPDKPCKICVHHGGEAEDILFDTCNQYTIQSDRFSKAVLEDIPVLTPLSDAVANMKVIDALFESAKKGGWVELK